MNTKKIETALRKARKYIRTVESWRTIEPNRRTVMAFDSIVKDFTEGGEVEAIERALLELGVVV